VKTAALYLVPIKNYFQSKNVKFYLSAMSMKEIISTVHRYKAPSFNVVDSEEEQQ
jgi:hypothetical protein